MAMQLPTGASHKLESNGFLTRDFGSMVAGKIDLIR